VESLRTDLEGIVSFLNRDKEDQHGPDGDQPLDIAKRRHLIRKKAYKNHGKKSKRKQEHVNVIFRQYFICETSINTVIHFRNRKMKTSNSGLQEKTTHIVHQGHQKLKGSW
jgi:hypothetical protein